MAWTELRSSAVIGTGRRALLPDDVDGHPIADGPFGSTEERALAAAALLATQRRAGMAPKPAGETPEPSPLESRPTAPTAAVQLLDLALVGNLGRPADSSVLIQHWLDTAVAHGVVVPHHLLVGVLARATGVPALRPAARIAIGERGLWLAEQRPDWEWATIAVDQSTSDGRHDLTERFATSTGAARRDVLLALRSADPTYGRNLLAATWTSERATERASLISCLEVGLGPDDDAFLEAALDDKAKTVREAAAAVLDQLPGSARAARLRAVLAPLIDHHVGLVRKRITLAPLTEGTDLARDLPGAAPSGLRGALVRSAPLATWLDVSRSTPEQLAALPRDPEDLVTWWTDAAVAQRDRTWALALGLITGSPVLLQLIPGPWPVDVSRQIVAALRRQKVASIVLSRSEDLLIERIHPGAIGDVGTWQRELPADERQADASLRHIIQIVTTRTSITEAFS